MTWYYGGQGRTIAIETCEVARKSEKKYGLKMNSKKTGMVVCSENGEEHVNIRCTHGEELKQMKHFISTWGQLLTIKETVKRMYRQE